MLSRESLQEAASVKIRRPQSWSIQDRLILAQECRRKLDNYPALTRTMLARQIRMTAARLNQLLSLLRLAPQVQEQILALRSTAKSELRERALLALIDLDSAAQLKALRKLQE